MAIVTIKTPRNSINGFPIGVATQLTNTPRTRAIPIPTGKATAIPAILIAATISRFARLKIIPPIRADI